MSGLTLLRDAQNIVLDATTTLGCEKVGLLDALGRVLGEDIIAPRDNPPWNNSAMDGFAVRWEDIKKDHEITRPAELKIVEDIQAGQVATKIVGPGEAIRIMTGAPVPDEVDQDREQVERDCNYGQHHGRHRISDTGGHLVGNRFDAICIRTIDRRRHISVRIIELDQLPVAMFFQHFRVINVADVDCDTWLRQQESG